jgi:putative CocE/NonD family hydrolase
MKTKNDWHQLVSQPKYEVVLEEDVMVPMRDGVRLCVDIYRPKGQGKYPALVPVSQYGKDTQKLPTNPEYQPSDYVRGTGGHECGEQSYFVPRGYAMVISDLRGVGRSEGDYNLYWAKDAYDLIEWVAQQPWCDGNIGCTGMSAFAICQYMIAAEQPPHLKAIFPFEGLTDWYRQHYYVGGIFNYSFQFHIGNLRAIRGNPPPAIFKELTEQELKERIKELQRNPDIQCTPYLYQLTVVPEHQHRIFDLMMHPYDGQFYQWYSPHNFFEKIKIPTFLGTRWNGWPLHQPGDFDGYDKIPAPHKKFLAIPSDNYGGMDRPHHEIQDVCLRWYDYWLKGNDTGMMDEPPITIFVQGVNKWRYENEYPLKATEWTKFYLRKEGRLSTTPPKGEEEPQVFTSDPWAIPSEGSHRADVLKPAGPVPKVIYETEVLRQNVEITGPVALYWHASIMSRGVKARTWKASEFEVLEPLTNDTDWYLKIKDVDVDGGELVVAEGWLKASHYELDESKSKPYSPFHPHTRSLPIEPGQVILYACDLKHMCNTFLIGHKIRLEISAQDQEQALWYLLPHMAHVAHTIYSTEDKPSYLLLPLIPKGYNGAGEVEYPPEGPFRIAKFKHIPRW